MADTDIDELYELQQEFNRFIEAVTKDGIGGRPVVALHARITETLTAMRAILALMPALPANAPAAIEHWRQKMATIRLRLSLARGQGTELEHEVVLDLGDNES